MVKDLIENINKKLNLENLDLGKLNVLKCFNLMKNYKFNLNEHRTQFDSLIDVNVPNYYKHTLYRNDIFELILIRWDKGFESILHKHPNNGCILKVIDGLIQENRTFENELYESKKLKKDNIGYMHNILGSHKIKALETSYTLHLYSPPNYYN